MALFQKGVSGNKNGRPKGAIGKIKRAKAEFEKISDLQMNRDFLRAVITSNMEILQRFGVTSSPSATNKIAATKELARVNAQLAADDKEQREKQAALSGTSKPNENKATFNPQPLPLRKVNNNV